MDIQLVILKKVLKIYICRFCSKPLRNRYFHEKIHLFCPLC